MLPSFTFWNNFRKRNIPKENVRPNEWFIRCRSVSRRHCHPGSDVKEHDGRLDSVLKIIKDSGLKLNKSKCVFRTKALKFMGRVFEKDGMSTDVAKVKAIQNMPVPNDITELHRIFGMINYLGAYLPFNEVKRLV